MTNGADDQLCSVEPVSVAESAIDSGRKATVPSGSDSPESTLLSDQKSSLAGPTSEWDTYVDTQIRNDWVDLGHDEKAFCDEYLENGYNHRDAAVTIERSANAGIRILNKPLCREYILHAENKRRSRSLITEMFMEAQYFQLLDEANGEVEVAIVTGSGASLNAKRYDGNLKKAVLEAMGKLSGISKPELGDTQVNVIIDMNALTGNNKVVSEQ